MLRPSPLAFLRAHPAEARHALRVMAACGAAYALYAALALPQGYWAVFTTLIVMQASIGATVGASVDRMAGTLLGAALGGGAAALKPLYPRGLEVETLGLALVVATGLASYAAVLRPSLKVAPVTAAIMLLSSSGRLGPLHAALYRVVEIALGGGVGVAASLSIFPARSRTEVAKRTERVLEQLAALFDRYADWLRRREAEPAEALHDHHDATRAAVAAIERAVDDAERERAARLGDHHLSPATPRTLWRIRSEAVAIGRAMRAPWPPELRERLREPGLAMLLGDADFLRACARSLRSGGPVDRQALARRHEALATATAGLHQARLAEDTVLATVEAVFSFTFALEGLYGHLNDMADRIDEAVSGRRRRSWPRRRETPPIDAP